MPLPTIHINITANMVAAYAAVVSTATASIQFVNFLRDRVRLKVSVMTGRQIIGDPRRDAKQILIQVNITNIGRRPITVTGVNVMRLFPCETHYLLTDIQPQVPRELTEGQYVDAFVPQNEIVLAEIRSWNVSTSIGRTFHGNQAPWYKRILSDWRWKRHFKHQAKERSASKAASK